MKESPENKIKRKCNMVMQNDKMKGEILVIALNRIKMRGTKLVEATTRGKEARQEEDRKGDQEAGPRNGTRGHVQKTPKCIAMIKDSGLVTKTPLRRGGTQWRDPEEGPEAKTSLPEAEPKGETQGRVQTTPKCIVMINLIPLKDSGLVTETPCRGGTQRQDSGAGPEAKTPLTEAGPRGGTRGRVQTTPKRTAMINFIPLKDSGLVTKTPFCRGGTQRRDPEAGPEDKTPFPEAEPRRRAWGRVQATPKCIGMINFIPLKDGGLVIKTPFRRREDVETNEDNEEVAFFKTKLQDIEIIRLMDLRNGASVMEAIFSLKWNVEVKAVEGVNQIQNRSQRVTDEVAISRSNIKFQETFRRAISFQILKIPLKSCQDNQTNQVKEEEIFMKSRSTQYPRGSLSAK